MLHKPKTRTAKILFATLAVTLALAIGFVAEFQLIGASMDGNQAAPTQYVGEIRMYQASTVENAKSLCRKDGFIPVDGNLNEGTGNDAVVLGYTTTEDVNAALTDVRMMQMTSGFSTVNYAEVIERQYPGLDSMIDDEYKTIKEFRKNVENGSYNAQSALQYLNLFKIPELNMKLGDYYVSDQLSRPMLKKLFLQTASAVSTTSYNLLASGVSDGSAEDNWASRVYAHKDILDFPDDETDGSVDAGTNPFAELDRQYLSKAERLVKVIQDYSTKYQNGSARIAANNGDASVLNPENMTPEEMNDHGTESFYLIAHEVLNQYRFDDTQLLGDWLVEMGNLTLSNKAELRQLYPLVASMTFGQIFTMELVGIHCSIFYLNDLSGSENDFNKKLVEAQKICEEYDNTDAISVWSGVDQKLFEQDCAVTGDAQRYTNLRDTAENIVKRNRSIQVLEAISEACSLYMTIAGGIIVLLQLPTMVVTFLGWLGAISVSWCWTHGTMFFILLLLNRAAWFLGVISSLAMIVVIIIMIIVFLYDCFKPECDDLDYTTIPAMALDLQVDDNASERNGLLRYDLIQSPDGKADLNGYEGKQWNALYATQNTDAGKPIVVVDGKAPLIVQYNDAVNPAGYKAVKNFDELFAANLNANVREKDAPSVFLFYSAKGERADTTDVKDEDLPQGENEPETTDPDDKRLYIASVFMTCETSETIAKNKLIQQGYNVVDVNLSPDVYLVDSKGKHTENSYTYLGYTVTTNPKAAVTDIRIAKIQSTSRAVMYGTAKYTAAGYDARNNSICYTKDQNVGSPILADSLQVANKITDGKEGYEPVAYFGGSPYNFDVYNYEYYGNERGWEEAKFVFFRPSETYTSGTEYISGLFFVSGHDVTNSAYIKRSWKLTEYAERLGGKLLGDADLTKGKTWFRRGVTGRTRNVETYLCYTTTFNPKRAIYDVQFYAGTNKMENFVTTLTAYTGNKESNFAQTGYGIVPVFMQLYDKMAAFEYSHYELNNYEDFTVGSGESRSCCDHFVDNIIPGVTWQSVTTQPRSLYACGYKSGYAPLTTEDLVITGGEAPEGYASIQDVKTPYEKEPLNLAYYYHEKSDECSPAYLYINRAAPVRGKYIASVKVATYNPDPEWGRAERQANDKFSHDSCYISLLSASSEVLLSQSLALNSADAWYNRASSFNYDLSSSSYGDDTVFGALDYSAKAAYLGVTYTDNPSKAVYGLLRRKYQYGVKPSETMTVNGAKYSLVQNVMSQEPTPIASANGEMYYLYSTTSSGGSSTGDPVTEILISDKIFEPNMATVPTVTDGDTEAKKDFYGNITEAAVYAMPYGDAADSLFIHMRTNSSLTAIDSFYVGVGNSEKEAMADLLTQGANAYMPMNLNKGTATDAFVYIGYHIFNPDYVNTKRTKYYMESAVKDLYVYVGNDPQKRLTIDKRKYTLCCDRNLNYGTNGTPMYLYQTTALINDKDKQEASYITRIGAAQYDRVPADIAENRWENLLTTENKRINMNDGALGFDQTDGSHLVDSRIYVFVHRSDSYVKPEAVITGGYTTDTTTFGDVVLN